MAKRKSPVRHYVSMHRREGKVVQGYERGHGKPVPKKSKVMPKYLESTLFTHTDGAQGKLTPEAERLSKKGSVELEVNLPKGAYANFEKEHDYMWKNYHIDIADEEEEDYADDLFYNADLRSLMGHRIDSGHYVIFPEYYVPGYEDYWNALIKNSEVEEEE